MGRARFPTSARGMAGGVLPWLAGALVGAAAAMAAQDRAPPVPTPWTIRSIAQRSEARPDADSPRQDAQSRRFLHVTLGLAPGVADPKLHQFRVKDGRGSTIAEVYGFHRGRSVVVFEGDWSDLDGLYLDGLGHREPLLARAVEVHARKAASPDRKPPEMKAPPAPALVPSRKPQGEPSAPVVRARSPDRPKDAEKLHQEVTVTHKSRYRIQGLDLDSSLQYRVLSSLQLEPAGPDGSRMATQRVEEAQLVQGDALAQAVFPDLLRKLVGSTFRFTLSPERKVVRFEGPPQTIRAAGADPLAGGAPMLASVIDPDGWKELAELTFFQAHDSLAKGQRWQSPLTHSWGPLGSWTGRAEYTCVGREEGLDRISYKLRLAHQPPKAGQGGLPFELLGADFQHQESGGTMDYDRAKQRVVRAEEHFPVKGTLKVGLLGQETPLELDEQQTFTLRILEAK